MHIGNQLYSSLSQLARCSYLLLTELPTMLTVAEENFRLEYSASYSISSTMKHIKHISGINKLMEAILNIVQNKQCQTMEYDIQFTHCSSETPENERKRIIRKHRKKHIYDNLEPAAKKRTAEKMQKKYSKMNPTDKKELLCKAAQKYKTMDVSLKNEMLSNLKVKYQKRMMDKGTSIK